MPVSLINETFLYFLCYPGGVVVCSDFRGFLVEVIIVVTCREYELDTVYLTKCSARLKIKYYY